MSVSIATTTAAHPWCVVTLTLPRAQGELASAFFYALGVSGIEECDASPSDALLILRGYFPADAHAPDAVAVRARETFPDASVHIERIEWNPHDESWRQHFVPHAIVPGIVIAPSWAHYTPRKGEQVITLDPGMAFGTGLHATTRLCARALYETGRAAPASCSLIDVGSGTGILCLVAARMGLTAITAVENDPDACTVAAENFDLNEVRGIALTQDIACVKETYSLVVANILLSTLIELHDELARIAASGATMVLSGVTNDQVDELCEAYADIADHRATTTEGEWGCVVMTRRAHAAVLR